MRNTQKHDTKWMFRSFFLALLGVILLLSNGCNRKSGKSNGAARPMLFNRPGTYILNPSGYKLVLSIDQNAIVEFKVIDPKTSGAVLFSGDAGGDFSRWFLYWSSKEELWIYSGDIGIFAWRSPNGQKYTRTTVMNKDVNLIHQMPNIFFDALPNSLQHKWSSIRGGVP